jgi:hypothetical protein
MGAGRSQGAQKLSAESESYLNGMNKATKGDAYLSARGEIDKALKAGAGCNSFTPDTLVLLADGTTKPIKDIKIGDNVIATDPETGQTQAEPVTAVIIEDHQDKASSTSPSPTTP